MLRLWNTRSRSLEEFHPLQAGKVGMYLCGPTVYNPLQLGNWRTYLTGDLVRRVFGFLGYDVTHVMNITDVGHLVGDGDVGEDKLAREAMKTGKTAWEIARYYEQTCVDGMAALNMLPPSVMPRATEHIAEQIALVQGLEQKGYTYRISDGIYFDTRKFAAYGSLSGQSLEEKMAGARVEENPEKRQATDFALWKFAADGVKRQMEWESPWGVGFPGWHIECSAMSAKYLGETFDVHMGGVDLLPVHHENEIAQSEAASGRTFVRYWLHSEFLLVNGGRMGKSLGNAYTLDDLATRGFSAMDYRFFCLGAHYRSKLNFTWEALEGAKQAHTNLKSAFLSWAHGENVLPVLEFLTAFREALEEDLNLPKAIAVVWETVKSTAMPEEKRATLLAMDGVLGLGMTSWKQDVVDVPPAIHALAEQRWAARVAKDWAASDRLRDELVQAGWAMQDGKEGYVLVPVIKA